MLGQRILTAVVAAAALLVVLFVLPPLAAEIVIAVLFLAAAWEWSGFLSLRTVAGRVSYVAAIAALLVTVGWVFRGEATEYMVLRIGLAWWFAALIWVFFYPTRIARPVGWICGALVMVPAYKALVSLYSLKPEVLLFVLIIVWAADIGAYFAGKRFGRVKLAPNISPGKTWEGVIGGLSAVVALVLVSIKWLEIDIAIVVPFCLAVATLSIIGDLTVSMFKRNAGLKDSGRVFPGHGGVLDRIDSVAAAAPLFTLGIGWMGFV
ncbi:MAG TPA: phosphatidate cytidylyltransferase [Woeseiaceae bacterium]|jgi:phosphatidate cytidylyltransferase|nr:phosphatidate cytidylyltransferase [Woeseiaceae bacterium]